FSNSRGGMLSLTITGILAFLLIPKRPRDYLLFALVVALSLRLAGPEVRERFGMTFASKDDRDASAQSRLDYWAACWDSIQKRPLLGVGPHHWPLVIGEYGLPSGKEAHTLWLQIGAELGLPGVLCLLSFYGLCIARLWPLAREQIAATDPWFYYLARM